MLRICKFLNSSIIITAMFFPFGAALIYGIVSTFFSWEKFGWIDHNGRYFGIPALEHKMTGLILLIALLVFIKLSICLFKYIARKKSAVGQTLFYESVYVYFVAVVCRLFYLFSVNPHIQPFSDFGYVWALANGNLSNLPYRSLFAAWMNFSALEHAFVQLFGNDYILFLFLNVFVAGFSAVAVLVILDKVLANDGSKFTVSISGALLYAFYPASAVFTMNAAPDVYVVPLYLIAMYFLFLCDEKRKCRSYTSITYALLFGTFCGLSASLKSFAIIIIISYLIIAVIELLKKDNLIHKDIYIFLICLSVIFCSYCAVKNIILKLTEKTFNISMDYNTATPHYLLIGLNTEGEGQIHVGSLSRSFYRFILEGGMSIDEAAQKTKELLREDWNNNPEKIAPLFVKKSIWAWQDDVIPAVYYIKYNTDKSNALGVDYLKTILPSVAQIFYLFIIFTALIGTLYLLTNSGNGNLSLFCLVILGYFCITMISEAQSRYKYLIIPLVCMLSSFGIAYLSGIFIKIKKIGESMSKLI